MRQEHTRPLLYDVLPDGLGAFCTDHGYPSFRARQVLDWIYGKQVDSVELMSNLPSGFRTLLSDSFSLLLPRLVECTGETGQTQKLLLELADGQMIETVLIPATGRDRATVCLSSQVGCRYGCAFCASGQKGVIRNLSSGEVVSQVLAASRVLGRRPDNVVFMGIGEPFDNYEAVLRAVRLINHSSGLGVGARRITISTCGVVPGIDRLAGEGLQVELSVSLHATDDALRSRLMPVNACWPMDELLAACEAYTAKTKRIITFEYTLIDGMNDHPEQAGELARLLRRFPCRVNLIPLSPVAEFPGRRSSPASARHFCRVLESAGINTTLRDSKGAALKAACGQLRARASADGLNG